VNRDQLYFDLFQTALEGGINHWSQCSMYYWEAEYGVEDLQGFRADVHPVDSEDDEDWDRMVIDRRVIARGYTLATTLWRGRVSWSTGKPPVVIREDTDWDYDAGDADVIVQLGLFGDVTYG